MCERAQSHKSRWFINQWLIYWKEWDFFWLALLRAAQPLSFWCTFWVLAGGESVPLHEKLPHRHAATPPRQLLYNTQQVLLGSALIVLLLSVVSWMKSETNIPAKVVSTWLADCAGEKMNNVHRRCWTALIMAKQSVAGTAAVYTVAPQMGG